MRHHHTSSNKIVATRDYRWEILSIVVDSRIYRAERYRASTSFGNAVNDAESEINWLIFEATSRKIIERSISARSVTFSCNANFSYNACYLLNIQFVSTKKILPRLFLFTIQRSKVIKIILAIFSSEICLYRLIVFVSTKRFTNLT